jgi:hypothetical protein
MFAQGASRVAPRAGMMTLGMKRLGIALDVVATVAWVIYVGVASSGFVLDLPRVSLLGVTDCSLAGSRVGQGASPTDPYLQLVA